MVTKTAARDLATVEAEIAKTKEELANVKGTDTEVYARIVGYYRSVRNWNKGKRDEYDHRKMFIFDSSNERCVTGSAEKTAEKPVAEVQAAAVNVSEPARYEVFTRKTCPNCPPVKNYLSAVEVDGRAIDVDTPEGFKEAAEKGVLATPTVIVYDKLGNEITRAHNAAELSKVLMQKEVSVA